METNEQHSGGQKGPCLGANNNAPPWLQSVAFGDGVEGLWCEGVRLVGGAGDRVRNVGHTSEYSSAVNKFCIKKIDGH